MSLIIKVSFYGTAILFICILTGITKPGFIDIIKSLLGVFAYQYWFITIYIIMTIFSPYINRFLELMKYRELIFLWTIMFYVTYVLSWAIGNEIVGRLSCGFTLYITIFILVKKAPLLNKFFIKHRKWGILFIGLSVLFECLMSFLGEYTSISYSIIMKFQTTASPFMFFLSIYVFYIFKEWNLKTNKIINFFAMYSSGAYLLHGGANFIKNILWDKLFLVGEYFQGSTISYFIHYILCITGLFLLGVFCEFIYAITFGQLVRKLIDKLFSKYRLD